MYILIVIYKCIYDYKYNFFSIQESLTIVQQAELTSLSQWLSKMEDKIQQDIG